jgi:hypothetical protein
MSSSDAAARLTPARRRQESRRVPQLDQSILRRQPQDPRHVIEHVRTLGDDRPQRRIERKARGVEQANERVPGWARRAVLDPRDDRLGGPGPTGERTLGQSRAEAGVTKEIGGGSGVGGHGL